MKINPTDNGNIRITVTPDEFERLFWLLNSDPWLDDDGNDTLHRRFIGYRDSHGDIDRYVKWGQNLHVYR